MRSRFCAHTHELNRISQVGSIWRIPKHLRVVVAPLCQLVRNHQRLRYGHWLCMHCTITATESPPPSPSSSEELTLEDVFGSQLPSSYKDLIVGFTPQRSICKFVMACVRCVVPAVNVGCMRQQSHWPRKWWMRWCVRITMRSVTLGWTAGALACLRGCRELVAWCARGYAGWRTS